jgi:hypothetical protein
MTMITRSAPLATEPLPSANPAGRQAVKALAQALKAEDLPAAKEAYVQIVKNAPAGATWKPDSAFAAVGRALRDGDVVAAREAAKAGLQGLRPPGPPSIPGDPEPSPTKVPSTTGGTSGTLLNVVA